MTQTPTMTGLQRTLDFIAGKPVDRLPFHPIIQNGTPEQIAASVRDCQHQVGGRSIVSAGCEITPGTSDANMRALRAAAAGSL